MTTGLRVVAIVIAAAAFVDPAWSVGRAVPPNVRIVPSAGVDREQVSAVRRGLEAALSGRVTFDDRRPGAATVVIGDEVSSRLIEDGTPVSVIATREPGAAHATLRAWDPVPAVPGLAAPIPALVRAHGMAGRTSTIALEYDGVEMARVEHRWTGNDEAIEPVLSLVPPRPGVFDIAVVVRQAGAPASLQARADVRLLAEPRRLRVLTLELRPSWALAFVRRALEQDPVFEVAALVTTSRNIRLRAGDPPARLEARSLEPFDAVVVGAPEDLTAAETEALERFVRLRGGAVLWLPDRMPGGPYRDLLPFGGFDEWLTGKSQALAAAAGELSGGEFALPGSRPQGLETIASVVRDERGQPRPVVVRWSHGAGRFVFSGALDAWRRRSDAFGTFWRTVVADAALAAPRPLTLAVSPAVTAPDTSALVRLRVRPDVLDTTRESVETPEVSARVQAPSGSDRWVRLWPTAEPGVFEGTVAVDGEGDHEVIATSSTGESARSVLTVRSGAASRPRSGIDPAAIAEATGGVVAAPGGLMPLIEHLRPLPAGARAERVYPMRSIWWGVSFAGLLSLEWTLRRRAGAI
jgi:hypothetical protein